MGPGRMMMHMWFQRGMNERIDIPPSSPIIFVGLDMEPIQAARKVDTRHTIVMWYTSSKRFRGDILLAFSAGLSVYQNLFDPNKGVLGQPGRKHANRSYGHRLRRHDSLL